MKIVKNEILISRGEFSKSEQWLEIRKSLLNSILNIVWPPNSDSFTIYPQSGKRHGEGNGVKPIKLGLMHQLEELGWNIEHPLDVATLKRPGKLDAVYFTDYGPFALEWETGNISSSHRALNKMSIGLIQESLVGGILVVPSRKLYKYLTDRIGNYDELVPYLDLWRSIPCNNGILEIIVIEHDYESMDVPRIPKGTDGRALR